MRPRLAHPLLQPPRALDQAALTLCLAASLLLATGSAHAQDALRNSLAGDAAAAANRRTLESQPYMIKTGDFRFSAIPSMGFDWNDNINVSQSSPEQDFILTPMLRLVSSYPITSANLLQLNVGVGYNKYLEHDQFSTWYVQPASALSFDVYVKDFWFNFHDRFSYSQNSAQEAAVANTPANSGGYGSLQNDAGLNTTWDLQDVILSLGYDHLNIKSTTPQFQQTDHSSESLVPRAGLRLKPSLTAGVEGTVAFTTYDQPILNDNTSYSAGLWADWRPGPFLHIQPRAGYSIYAFQQTSKTIPAVDQNTWYADLTVSHDLSRAVTYGFSAGHEIRLGIYSDSIQDWYFRPNVQWKIIKDVGLRTGLTYEHGTQSSAGGLYGVAGEVYDQYAGDLGISYSPMKKVSVSLNYRLTLRSSDLALRAYNQDVVSLSITYTPASL